MEERKKKRWDARREERKDEREGESVTVAVFQ